MVRSLPFTSLNGGKRFFCKEGIPEGEIHFLYIIFEECLSRSPPLNIPCEARLLVWYLSLFRQNRVD